MTRLFAYKIMLWITATFFVACFGILVYARWFEKPWLSYQNLPFPPAILKVHPGETVPMLIERCNSTRARKDYVITHSLLNADSKNLGVLPVLLPDVHLSIDAGCNRYVTKAHIVPVDTVPGTYKFFGVAFAKGLFITHEVEWYSEEFEVVKPEKVKL